MALRLSPHDSLFPLAQKRGNRWGIGWFRLHALPNGQTVDISYSIMFDLRDGLIVKYHFLENTFDVAAAFRSDGEWLLETDDAKHRVPIKRRSRPKRRGAKR